MVNTHYHVSALHATESGSERLLAAPRSYGYVSRLAHRSRSLSAALGSSMGFSDSLYEYYASANNDENYQQMRREHIRRYES